MNPSISNLLKKRFPDTLQFNIPLRNQSYLKIGGTAAYFLTLSTPDEVTEAVLFLQEHGLKYFILGRGTNTLIREGLLDTVILHFARTREATFYAESHEISYPAGTLLMQAIKTALHYRLGGMEFAIGIPGSVGGAVKMNAGTRLGEVKDVLKTALVLRHHNHLASATEETPTSLALGYRTSNIQSGEVILSARFALRPLSPQETTTAKQFVLTQLSKRKQTQPLGVPSLGSSFKNPPAIDGEAQHAAKLIEAAGLKGKRIGGIEVSPLHANFIVNDGTGTAEDARMLLELMENTVYKKFNITLKREIVSLGW